MVMVITMLIKLVMMILTTSPSPRLNPSLVPTPLVPGKKTDEPHVIAASLIYSSFNPQLPADP